MPFWTMLLTYVVTFLITELLRPKPELENAKPAGLGDFQVPTATEGRVIPIVFGRVNIKGPNVVWYGDLRTEEIEEEVQTGLFSSEDVTIGYEYYLGVQLALCRGPFTGPNDRLGNIRNDDSFVFGPDGPNSESRLDISSDSGTTFLIDVRNHFGEPDEPGQGGLRIPCTAYPGSQTQSTNGYLSGQQSPLPAYRGTMYIVFRQGWIGNSPNLRNFEFEVQRFPDGLLLATFQPGDEIVVQGANPMNVVYEILTDQEWGLNLTSSEIDVAGFRAAAATLAAEGNGFAWIWDRAREASEIIAQIEQQVDGVLVQDPLTGIFGFTLIRDDYTPGTLPLLDESNVISVDKFKRPSWNTTANVVSLQFNDRRKSFAVSYATAQDSANVDIQQKVNLSEIKYPGVKDATLANALCWRELRLLSSPVATGRLTVNRTQYELKPGDVRELTWDRLGLVRLPIRITRINRGNLLNGTITIDFSEDIFLASPGSFSDPSDTNWTPPVTDAVAPLDVRLIEIPYVLTNANLAGINTIQVQIGVLLVRGGTQEIGYKKFTTVADSPTIPGDPAEGDTLLPVRTNGTTPSGLLTAALDKGQTNGFQDAVGFSVDNPVNLERLADVNPSQLESLQNACMIDDEIILFSDVTDAGGGVFNIFNLIRGALDTVPADHADNARVYFFSYGTGLVNQTPESDITQIWKVRAQVFTSFNTIDFATTTVNQIETNGRAGRAYPPRDVQVNPGTPGGGYFPTDGGSPSMANIVGSLSIRWHGSDKFLQARATAWDDPHVVQEGGSGFRIRVIEDPGGADTVVLDVTGIPAGATEGAYNAIGFMDDTVTDLYQMEISSVNGNGESQVWTFGPYTVYGFGYKFDEKFGGDTNGVFLPKGSQPLTIDVIPGVTQTATITVTATGTFNSLDALTARISFLENGQTSGQHENYTVVGGGKTSITDYLIDLGDQIAADFDPVKVQVAVDQVTNVLTIQTSFGSLGGDIFIRPNDASLTEVQPAPGGLLGDQVVHFDLYDADPQTTPATELPAADALPSYNADAFQENVLDFSIKALTLATRDRIPRNGLEAQIRWGGREVSPGTQGVLRDLPLRDGEPNTPVAGYDSSLLGQFQRFADANPEIIRQVTWSRFDTVQAGGDSSPDRVGVEVWVRSNFELVAPQSYDTAPVNTIYDGAFGPLKLLGKNIAPPNPSSTANQTGILRLVFNLPIDDQYGQGGVVIGQEFRVNLEGNLFTETANAGDVTDNKFHDDIYARLKTSIDAFGGGSVYLCTLNLADRDVPGGATFVSSMNINKVSASNFTSFSASSSFGLELDVDITLT